MYLDHEVLDHTVTGAAFVTSGQSILPAWHFGALKYVGFGTLSQPHQCACSAQVHERDTPLQMCSHLYSPVQSCLKFSHVFGQMSAKSSIWILPAGWPPSVISAGNSLSLISHIEAMIAFSQQQIYDCYSFPHRRRLQDFQAAVTVGAIEWCRPCSKDSLPAADRLDRMDKFKTINR